MIQQSRKVAAAAALTLALLFPVTRHAAAQAAATAPAKSGATTLVGSGSIVFKGTSTLHDFEGQVAVQPFSIRISEGKNARWSAEATVPVAQMNTGNAKRDKSMYEMFDLPAYPAIVGKVSDSPVPSGGTGTVDMTLRIRDKRQTVPVRVTNWRMDGDSLSFHGTAQVSLNQFGLVPPSVLRMIKVRDTVTLEGDFRAAPKGRAVAQGASR